jgi:hypothetical protein
LLAFNETKPVGAGQGIGNDGFDAVDRNLAGTAARESNATDDRVRTRRAGVVDFENTKSGFASMLSMFSGSGRLPSSDTEKARYSVHPVCEKSRMPKSVRKRIVNSC